MDLPFVIQVGETQMRRSTNLRGLQEKFRDMDFSKYDDDNDAEEVTNRRVEMRKLSDLPFQESLRHLL